MIALSLAVALALAGAPKATPPKKTQLKIEVKPAAAVVYVDGKRKGTGAKPMAFTVEPGRHTIRIVHNKDEHQEVIVVKKGETTSWSWAFEDDRRDKKLPASEQETNEPAKEGAKVPR